MNRYVPGCCSCAAPVGGITCMGCNLPKSTLHLDWSYRLYPGLSGISGSQSDVLTFYPTPPADAGTSFSTTNNAWYSDGPVQDVGGPCGKYRLYTYCQGTSMLLRIFFTSTNPPNWGGFHTGCGSGGSYGGLITANPTTGTNPSVCSPLGIVFPANATGAFAGGVLTLP